jgi:alanyl-tRNA synthetase
MTDRIYFTDPYCRVFEAVVTQAFEHEGRPAVALDRTAFYPTSGGQPFDIGRLGGVQVLDVVDQGDVIAHVLSSPLPVGTPVAGEIDWARRFDHMQQHTGQHILSAALHRLFDNRTVSVHFGSDVATIDLQREPPAAEIERAVDEANRVVWDDVPVAIRFASDAERATLELRKESVREGTLRLIEVEGFDLSACGGTHVARTGAIGVIAVLGAERFKGGSRLTFVCGGRAVSALRGYRDAVTGSIRALSVLPAELPAAIERLQGEAKALRRTVKGMQESLAGHEASRLVGEAETVAGVRTVVRVLEGWDAAGLKAIAAGITAAGNAVAVLVSASSPCLVVIARSPDAPGDAGVVLRTLIGQFGGRGGGKPDLAQAGGLSGPPADVATAALSMLRS